MNYFSKVYNSLRTNFLFFISVTGAFLLHLTIAWQPLERLEFYSLPYSNGPLLDDSYIFFSMSKDFAAWFSGFSSSVPLTSGFQPLVAFLFLPLFELFWNQKETAIHLALSLNALLGLCANILLYGLLRRVFSRPVATFLLSIWIWSPYVMNQTINGMETTLSSLFIFLTLNFYLRFNYPDPFNSRNWMILGGLLGIGFWARVDIGLLGVAMVLDQLWLTIINKLPSPIVRVKNICMCSIVSLCFASPWIVFTIIRTGNIVPVSGKAVHLITTTFFDFYHPDYSHFFSLMFMYFKKEFLIYQPLSALSGNTLFQLAILGLGLIGLSIIVRDQKLRDFYRPMFIFQTIMIIAYIGFIGGFWHLNRYFYPVYSFILPIHGATLHWLKSKVKIKPRLIGILLFILFIPYGVSYGLQFYSQWTRKCPPRYLSIALFAKKNIPPKAKVGAFQSGCVSYWLDNTVVNLDGVMNEDAYVHLKNKTMDVYLKNQQIDYLVEEAVLFEMWDRFLGGQLSRDYVLISRKREKALPRLWQKSAIYKRRIAK